MQISTERLELREYAEADHDAVHAFASDPEVCRFVEWGPNTPGDTRVFLRACLDEQITDPRQTYTLAITVGGWVIGSIALMLGDSELAPGRGSAELGYVLGTGDWGSGYASEAAVAMLDFARGTLGLERVVATCRPENTGSIRVLEKSGLRRAGLLPGHKVIDGVARDSLLFAIDL
ncbi:GNAT family N-acetyltransferase [Paeniglutamicibacter kerguelensis]|uniref:RimJ/RimL family protein N-acetyltransferase n=1 Tax=Paeniglutamicibacter kerguelensis TaxID=254788 RepID=A0ABS4XFU5_9MICC|nr:GNAT family N-acetyltransferase [Paeniglutamicibacter kerguelensis]MBP2387320.1 RimJ/RimL family protein N-acetyltransferase [Paeniglutamicibacter kerguelensis]